ncbi:MAG: hypothetical protein LBU04_07710 [Christensenellaceae bacterium]|jgi:septum formation topological specificity factor MinE|nr:hypothetical protein [Christensenellaceae bacterium]
MKSNNSRTYSRLKIVLSKEKTIPDGLSEALSYDIQEILSSYFEYDIKNQTIAFEESSDGFLTVIIKTPINRIKNIKLI